MTNDSLVGKKFKISKCLTCSKEQRHRLAELGLHPMVVVEVVNDDGINLVLNVQDCFTLAVNKEMIVPWLWTVNKPA